jgi:hypothetical protein
MCRTQFFKHDFLSLFLTGLYPCDWYVGQNFHEVYNIIRSSCEMMKDESTFVSHAKQNKAKQ